MTARVHFIDVVPRVALLRVDVEAGCATCLRTFSRTCFCNLAAEVEEVTTM